MRNIITDSYRYLKLLKKYNSVSLKYETLQNEVKEEVFKKMLEQVNVPLTLDQLKRENKQLRQKVKVLKELLKENKVKK